MPLNATSFEFAANATPRCANEVHAPTATAAIKQLASTIAFILCLTSKMSHDWDWRDSRLCTRRDSPGRWLWRLVGLRGLRDANRCGERSETAYADQSRRHHETQR